MSNVPVIYGTGLDRHNLGKLFEGLPEEADDRRSELDKRLGRGVLSLLSRFETLARILDSEVSLGFPDDGTGAQRAGNVRGAWGAVLVTGGLGGAFLFTHNLGVPVQAVPGRAYNLANVRWAAPCFTHGDRTGVNGAPTAAANPAHSTVHFRVGDLVTENTIELRVHSNLTVSASAPLLVEVRFSPAVI